MSGDSRRLRLRGEVQGVERSYLLAPGPNRIGSADGNDIVLPVRGVSREHARLSCTPEGVLLQDLDSKNGTLVNGGRIRSARVEPGDEIEIGPVALRLEHVEAADTELAIAIGTGEARSRSGLPPEETTTASGEAGRGSAAWLALVEGVLARLSVMPEQDLTGALGFLVKELRAQGSCVVEWSSGSDPVVLAASGQIESPLLHEGFQAFVNEALHRPGGVATCILSGDPVLSSAILSDSVHERLGLVVWGEFPGRPESEPLLRTLVNLLARFRSRPLHQMERLPHRGPRKLRFPDGYIPGESPAMTSLYGQMLPLLQGDLPVLILGETGVGKEYLARTLHASSPRRDGPFAAINCAAIPSELLEAELFGIGKGIATGVVERPGKFQLAEGGTLFLDEIGEMPPELQAKLLRALEEKEIHPVGSRPVPVDIRVLAATNSDLHRRMEEGHFRRDLFYRVAGYLLRVPSLRERKEDIPVLVEEFVQTFARETGKSIRGVTVKALRALVDYPWPGNIRELEHELRHLVYLCPDGEAIDSVMLSEQIVSPPAPARAEGTDDGGSLLLDEQLGRLESRLIRMALQRAGGNRTQAAKLLGISRNGLAIKMTRLGIRE